MLMAQEDQRYGRDKSTVVNKTYIESGEFRRKFDSVVDDPKIARILYPIAKEMLFHRSGTQTEDMYWIDYRASLVLCHDGTIYQYESNQKISEDLFDIYMKRFLEDGYSEKESQIKSLTAIKRNFDIDFWEVI